MEDIASDLVVSVARELVELKGQKVVALDVSATCSWARFVIIATGTSRTQLAGLYRDLVGVLQENGIRPRSTRKRNMEDDWLLLDCDDLVINLMSEKAREFYALEERWFDAGVLFD